MFVSRVLFAVSAFLLCARGHVAAARLFNDASSQYLEVATAAVTSEPLTMACWFNSNDATVNQTIIAIYTTGGETGWVLRASGAAAGDPVTALSFTTAGTGNSAATTTGWTANTWFHAAGVFTSSTSRTAYINGGSSATNTTSTTVGTPNATAIGRRYTGGGGAVYFSGLIGECGIWNVALTAADVAQHAAKVTALKIRRDALVGYWPVWGTYSTEIDLRGGLGMTVTGATAAAHPAVYYGADNIRGWRGTVAAGGSCVPCIQNSYRQRRMAWDENVPCLSESEEACAVH